MSMWLVPSVLQVMYTQAAITWVLLRPLERRGSADRSRRSMMRLSWMRRRKRRRRSRRMKSRRSRRGSRLMKRIVRRRSLKDGRRRTYLVRCLESASLKK